MNSVLDLDRVFPLSGGSAPRPALRPPRLTTLVTTTPGVVMGHRAFLRAWAGRRAQAAGLAVGRNNVTNPG